MVGCGQLWDGFRHHRDTEETDMADTTTMTTPATEYELRGPAAWIRLTRAKKMNAIDGDVIDGIAAGLDHASGDGARSVVLTGSGPVFCAGADLKSALKGLDDFTAIDGLLAD